MKPHTGTTPHPPKLCAASKKIRAALAEDGYRAGWQLATDPKSEYRPHYMLTGYVGRAGVIVVQDYYDPEEPTTDAVDVYVPIVGPTNRAADVIAALRARAKEGV